MERAEERRLQDGLMVRATAAGGNVGDAAGGKTCAGGNAGVGSGNVGERASRAERPARRSCDLLKGGWRMRKRDGA